MFGIHPFYYVFTTFLIYFLISDLLCDYTDVVLQGLVEERALKMYRIFIYKYTSRAQAETNSRSPTSDPRKEIRSTLAKRSHA